MRSYGWKFLTKVSLKSLIYIIALCGLFNDCLHIDCITSNAKLSSLYHSMQSIEKFNTVWCARECVYAVCLIAIESPYYILQRWSTGRQIYSWMLLMAIERAFGPRRQRIYSLAQYMPLILYYVLYVPGIQLASTNDRYTLPLVN